MTSGGRLRGFRLTRSAKPRPKPSGGRTETLTGLLPLPFPRFFACGWRTYLFNAACRPPAAVFYLAACQIGRDAAKHDLPPDLEAVSECRSGDHELSLKYRKYDQSGLWPSTSVSLACICSNDLTHDFLVRKGTRVRTAADVVIENRATPATNENLRRRLLDRCTSTRWMGGKWTGTGLEV